MQLLLILDRVSQLRQVLVLIPVDLLLQLLHLNLLLGLNSFKLFDFVLLHLYLLLRLICFFNGLFQCFFRSLDGTCILFVVLVVLPLQLLKLLLTFLLILDSFLKALTQRLLH